MLSLGKDLFEKVSVSVELGFNCLVFEEDIFVYQSFEASTSSNVSSIDYCSFTGVCVTDFMRLTQISELMNPVVFKSKLTDKLDSLKPIKIKFNKMMPYMLFYKY